MSQSKVTAFYAKRRSARNQKNKGTNLDGKNISSPIKEEIHNLEEPNSKLKSIDDKIKISYKPESEIISKNDDTKSIKEVKKKVTKRATKTTKVSSKKTTKSNSSASQTKVTNFYESTHKIDEDISATESKESPCLENNTVLTLAKTSQSSTVVKTICNNDESKIVTEQTVPLSPKRNLINPQEGTPPKKKTFVDGQFDGPTSISIKRTPRKLMFPSTEQPTSSPVSDKVEKTEEKARNLSEETKKLITSYKEKIALCRNYETNPYKVTTVISPSEQAEKTSALPKVPAYQRYSYLVDADASSLVLPAKYKFLSEVFRSLDTVISMLNNRKEKITFEKAKEGVQKMMKRTFSKTHLGQIVTVYPSAYNIVLEKKAFKKSSDPEYDLIITPVLNAPEGGSKSKSKGIINMTPQDLLDRKKEFDYKLLCLVKDHHKVFLGRMNFPSLPTQTIKRWHPKFQVDSVPDIEVAKLPEVPEAKICSAKDVLSKIVKGSLKSKQKVVKALMSVAEESTTPSNKKAEIEQTKEKLPESKSALKGVCSDLIAKVRAREAEKLLQCMTESPDETKRKAMLERLPKIVQILWHYFIAERKAAVPVDTAVEKIIHSFNSLSTHEEVKAHLTLITETFPGWLSFIQIPKGVYITMDKNKNITEMLDKFQYTL